MPARGEQTENGPSGLRLSRTGFTNDAELLTTKLETHTTHRLHRALGCVEADMQILDGRQVQGTASAEARRSITVPEGITLNERERVWYKLTQDTMNDLNDQLEATIKSAFFPYIVL